MLSWIFTSRSQKVRDEWDRALQRNHAPGDFFDKVMAARIARHLVMCGFDTADLMKAMPQAERAVLAQASLLLKTERNPRKERLFHDIRPFIDRVCGADTHLANRAYLAGLVAFFMTHQQFIEHSANKDLVPEDEEPTETAKHARATWFLCPMRSQARRCGWKSSKRTSGGRARACWTC